MKGTSSLVTLEILEIPPSTTRMVSRVTNRPIFAFGSPKDRDRASAMELDWVMFPMPKEANTARMAKQLPRNFPSLLLPRAFTQVYMGPPARSPFSLTLLYFTDRVLSASFVAMPMILVTTIQNRAPGPPNTMAVVTPRMLPVPIVTASSVVKAEKEEIPPFVFGPRPLSSRPKMHRKANPRLCRGRKSMRIIR